jgi:hypothetical protein
MIIARNQAAIAAMQADRLDRAKAAAQARLIGVMSAARLAFVTPLPGQDMVYLAKETEARAWVGEVSPDLADYPLLSAEVGITAPDANQLAQLWLNMASLWRGAAAELEGLRLSTQAAIAAAGSEAELATIMESLQ